MINAKDARKLAEAIRKADVFEEILPFLDDAFPLIDWVDLIKLNCPKCGTRSRLVDPTVGDCLHCSSS